MTFCVPKEKKVVASQIKPQDDVRFWYSDLLTKAENKWVPLKFQVATSWKRWGCTGAVKSGILAVPQKPATDGS